MDSEMELTPEYLEKRELQKLCIEAFTLQKRAMHLTRWSYLNENGAFQLRDAANALRQATTALENVSLRLLRAHSRYSSLRAEKPKIRSLRVA